MGGDGRGEVPLAGGEGPAPRVHGEMTAGTAVVMDVEQRAALPFPRSLPEFQRLFPDDFNRRSFNAFRSLLGLAGSARAPTYDELYSGDWAHPTSSECMA